MGAARWADAEAAARAVDRVRPLIDAALACRAMGESGFLHVVVMDPLAAGLPFEQAVLYEESFGDTRRWDADYGAYARRKAALSWRTGLDSHTALAARPHLVAQDETVWGSVCVEGIVVAVSGLNPWYDEAMAGAIAHMFKAEAKAGAQAA
ncbi:hypothetical protein [Bordetella genomosp. 6]|uniref:Uncharacterized protein n=1 Tax=Bordetella genomosp. 6 TaxID=463024 RepID=A0ABX4FKA4_9BORD|nr:hypothetical protein [Bordetella genomosp. 6]OZI81997.1 hypothetical protein CAL23_09955 [Bordetella genomosp. 6]